ncbi:uncharacterized protein LOC117151658 [Bombus impatiens]|uniref:Uncharacterized protein LOC117151658 n=1 Tax=Bombus impatiens TaxID=132113 RepID=A0A6P8KZP3_BOMIM|nr:uncharacterized protein LOC117151658 [Bombus impatiens]
MATSSAESHITWRRGSPGLRKGIFLSSRAKAPGHVSAPGEVGSSRMEVAEESPRRVTRSSRAMSDDEESVVSFASRSSLASTASRGKNRRIMSTTPDVSEELSIEVRASSAADVSAEFTRNVAQIIGVATISLATGTM